MSASPHCGGWCAASFITGCYHRLLSQVAITGGYHRRLSQAVVASVAICSELFRAGASSCLSPDGHGAASHCWSGRSCPRSYNTSCHNTAVCAAICCCACRHSIFCDMSSTSATNHTWTRSIPRQASLQSEMDGWLLLLQGCSSFGIIPATCTCWSAVLGHGRTYRALTRVMTPTLAPSACRKSLPAH